MRFWSKFTALFRRRNLDADMAEEMREHLERRTQANLKAGLSHDEARYAAQRQFGGLDQLKEIARDQRRGAWLDAGRRELRLAMRSLAKSPGFTSIALLTLALGIGVNTSMFSVLNSLQFRTPYPDDGRLVRLLRTTPQSPSPLFSAANFLDARAQATSFEQLTAVTWVDYSLAEPGHPAERLRGLNVTADFFPMLGIAPELGQVFTAEDDQPGKNNVVVISHEAWVRLFSADRAVLGRAIRMSGEIVTIVGVMPERFEWVNFWARIDVWRPMGFPAPGAADRSRNYLNAIGRLKPGVALAQAQAEIAAIAQRLAADFASENARVGMNLVPLARSVYSGVNAQLIWFIVGLAGLVLAIACVNLANLQFARHAARVREQAIRAALGASRAQLMAGVLVESVLLSLVGGVLGVGLALGSNAVLGRHFAVDSVLGVPIALDWRVLGLAFLVASVTGLVFGALPAWFASRPHVQEALKQGARGSTASRAQHRLRHALIVAEVALALVLLSSAGFFARGLHGFIDRARGWQSENLLTAYVTLPSARYADNAAVLAFSERLRARLGELPGVDRAAVSGTLPFMLFGAGQPFAVEGRPPSGPGAELRRFVATVSPEYFATLEIAFVAGRNFAASDLQGPPRVIINEAMARQLWPKESALGKRLRQPDQPEWHEVIGVVRNVSGALNLEAPVTNFQSYRLLPRDPGRNLALSLRSSLPPATLATAVRRAAAEIDPELPLLNLRPASQTIALNLANFSVGAWLLSGFALLGLFLAALGLYGVISGYVVQRTGEIGIRMALGAQVRDVLRLVLGQGLRLTLFGAVLGLAGAVAVARVLAAFVPVFPPAEFGTAALVALLLVVVSALACWLPARRASRVDPLVALRSE